MYGTYQQTNPSCRITCTGKRGCRDSDCMMAVRARLGDGPLLSWLLDYDVGVRRDGGPGALPELGSLGQLATPV